MRGSFIEKLECPSCGGEFSAKVFRESRQGLEEGTLTCRVCGRLAPVIEGVPRILPAYLNRALVARFPDYFRRNAVTVPLEPPSGSFDKLNQAIFDAFNYNWVAPKTLMRHFSKAKPKRDDDDPLHREDRRVFLDNVAPLDAGFFRGKLGLDVGCNVGRYLHAAHEYGAEMVGLEQTFAVDRAREKTRKIEGIHLVQGSLFEFPLKQDIFDLAFSFGVLHHTPDAQDAFRVVSKAIKPGGAFLTMIYGLEEMPRWYRISHMRSLRALTSRIPLVVTRKVCEALAVVMKFGLILPLSMLSEAPGIGSAAKRFPFMYLRNDSALSISRNFFDRLAPPVTTFHTRQEIEGWYRDMGFSNVQVSRRQANAWRAYGLRAA